MTMSWSPSHLVVWPNFEVECLEKEPPGSGEACDACRIILLNTSLLLYVLVVENETNGAWRTSRPPGTIRHMEDTDA